MPPFDEVKERVKDASDLVSLVESYLPLRARGSNMIALCPFHQEKTPSFTIFPDSQYFKCFGCGKAGDVFTFVMEREGVNFREALEILASSAGISLEGVFGSARSDRPRVDVHAVLGEVAQLFRRTLDSRAGTRARSYLQDRGLLASAESFELGAHPDAPGSLSGLARDRGLPLDVLRQAGLLKEDGYEPFRGRVMFPIHDERGRLVGFGGRDLGDARAKYLNSPESPFFHKGRVLYGLRHAKQAGERRIIVVEGYTDVIACHLAGFEGAVASLGTAFTAEHARALVRYATDGVILLFDGDRAGREAAAKAFEELVRTELSVRIALLPEGSDPADMLVHRPGVTADEINQGKARFEQILGEADDALNMWFRLKRETVDLSLEANIPKVVRECGRLLTAVEDPAQREVLLGRMAAHLGLGVETMQQSLRGQLRGQGPKPGGEGPQSEEPTVRILAPESSAELGILACVLAAPEFAEELAEESFDDESVEYLRQALLEGVRRKIGDSDRLLAHLFTACAEAPQIADLLGHCADMMRHIKDPSESFQQACRTRQEQRGRRAAAQTRRLLKHARDAGDAERVRELTQLYMNQLRNTESEEFGATGLAAGPST